MKKKEQDFERALSNAIKGQQIPILVLDTRWHSLFPKSGKPSHIASLEEDLNVLLKRQGFLVNDLKNSKKTKKKLMESIVANMGKDSPQDIKRKEKQQELLLEINERITTESDELMELPRQIKQANEILMIESARYCFERLSESDEQVKELDTEIREIRSVLRDKQEEKEYLEESRDSAYSLMHSILGRSVMNLFDHK